MLIKNINTSALFATAPIHVVLIRNDTNFTSQWEYFRGIFCQIQRRGEAAAAPHVRSKRYLNSYRYSAEKQHRETEAGPARAPKAEAGALAAEHGSALGGQRCQCPRAAQHLPAAACTALYASPQALAGVPLPDADLPGPES